MKKRFLAILLALVMMLTLLPAVALADRTSYQSYEQEVPGGTITYRSDIEYALLVSGWLDSGEWYVYSCSDGVTQADILPSITVSVDGGVYSGPVTSVDSNAFRNKTNLTSVTFPNSNIKIRGEAFMGCTSLTSVTIPSGLKDIGLHAFRGTPWLESMGEFPVVNGVLLDYQGKGGLITIPNGVTEIVGGVFTNNTDLTGVTLPDGFASIGKETFKGCTGLTSVTIPNSVVSIGDEAFNGCKSLANVSIPSSVTSIGEWAFVNCTGLTHVTTSESTKDIGRGAFSKTPWLEAQGEFPTANGILLEYCGKGGAVTIPAGVISIGNSAFIYCKDLTDVTIPDSVASIGTYAFSGCTGLTSVIIPDSVTSIGSQAFYGCENLSSVTLPSGITEMGMRMFNNCKNLSSVTIPDGVTSIGDHSFDYCKALASVTIPNSVTSIGRYAFYSCSSLIDVSYGGTEAQWKAISIGDYNEPLLNTTIHYSGATTPTQPQTTNPSNNPLSVNGKAASTAVYKIDGNNYFKLRDVAALLNGSAKQFNVGYDSATKSATVTTGQGYSKQPTDLQPAPAGVQTAMVSNDSVLINGTKANLTVYKINGANYFKLRDLGKALDFYVGYDNATKSVSIDTSKPYSDN